MIEGLGMKASMSGTGNCFDNAPMESFWATLSTVMQKCTKSGNEKCTSPRGLTWYSSRTTEEVAMITEEAFMDIMALHRQGHSMRFIARKLGLHRNTVKKFILGKRFPEYQRSERRVSVLAPFVRIIQDWLEQDNYRASWIFDRLKPIGYEGSYETVKKFIRPIKEQQTRIAYARFETMPGLQAQVDWADFQIAEPNGKTSTVYLFILVLGYCRAIYAEFVNRCTLESFLDGHIRAFRYLGGVPAEVLYDNMKHVVIRRLVGKIAFNPELLHFAHHYGFAPKACPPYAAWVKGKVERPVDYIRESFWRGYAFNSDFRAAPHEVQLRPLSC